MRNLQLSLVGILGTMACLGAGCGSGTGMESGTGGTIGNGGVVGTGGVIGVVGAGGIVDGGTLVGVGGVVGGGGTSGGEVGVTTVVQRPIDSTEATTSITQRVDILIAGLADTTAQLDTSNSTTVITQGLSAAAGSSSACSTGGSFGGGSSSTPVSASSTQDLTDFLNRVAKEAKDHVFREEFVELKDGNQVVYKINPTVTCGQNTTCLQKLTANPVRFQVTASSDDTLNVSVLFGAAQLAPATAVVGPTKLSARVDLAKALEAVRLYTAATNQQNLPDHLNGVVAGSLEKLADFDFAIGSSIVEKFDLLVGQAKGKPVAVAVQPSNPGALVTLNSTTNTVGYTANLGAVDVQVAGAAACDSTCGTKEQTGTFTGHLGGFTVDSSLRKAATELTFSGLGIGSDTSQVALNGDPLGTLDVNANNGRKLSVSIKKTSDGTLITFDPALDMKLALMLNKLSESLRVDWPDWLSDEIFDVMLGGATKPSVLVPNPTCNTLGDVTSKSELKVVTGNLSLSASSLSAPVTVAVGMCLLAVDGADSKANPVSRVQGGACQ